MGHGVDVPTDPQEARQLMSQNTPEIDLDQLARSAQDGATVIDVREPAEYVAGHVPGATPVPMGQLPSRLGELDRSRPVYVVCASGNRSAAMTDVLVASGFDAYSVAGGTGAWARSGRPVDTGAPRA
jgi:rhodanese-related sulfurtransferase